MAQEDESTATREPPLSFRSNFYRTQRGATVSAREPYAVSTGGNKYSGVSTGNKYSGGFMENFEKQQREIRKGQTDKTFEGQFKRGGPSPVRSRASWPATRRVLCHHSATRQRPTPRRLSSRTRRSLGYVRRRRFYHGVSAVKVARCR